MGGRPASACTGPAFITKRHRLEEGVSLPNQILKKNKKHEPSVAAQNFSRLPNLSQRVPIRFAQCAVRSHPPTSLRLQAVARLSSCPNGEAWFRYRSFDWPGAFASPKRRLTARAIRVWWSVVVPVEDRKWSKPEERSGNVSVLKFPHFSSCSLGFVTISGVSSSSVRYSGSQVRNLHRPPIKIRGSFCVPLISIRPAGTVSESVGHADVGESYVAGGPRVFEEASGNKSRHIDANGRVQIERP
jgi:hypothetical protein